MANKISSHNTQNPAWESEFLRFTFCGTIIASLFAVIAAGPVIKNIVSPGGFQIGTTVLALSAIFSFLYILCIGSMLKYESPGKIDRFIITPKVASSFYDSSINIFGLYIFVELAQFILVRLLHLTVWWEIAAGYLLGSGFIYLVALLAWALIRRLIEKLYDLREQTK